MLFAVRSIDLPLIHNFGTQGSINTLFAAAVYPNHSCMYQAFLLVIVQFPWDSSQKGEVDGFTVRLKQV